MKHVASFKNKVYDVVGKISRGRVLTYKEVAKKAGSPRASRAVGNILNKNRNTKIPCHRVIKSDGKIGGYNRGAKRKIYLLKKEGIKINKGKVLTDALLKK
jgi:O-6-methylguanine DNA methyltransferase